MPITKERLTETQFSMIHLALDLCCRDAAVRNEKLMRWDRMFYCNAEKAMICELEENAAWYLALLRVYLADHLDAFTGTDFIEFNDLIVWLEVIE